MIVVTGAAGFIGSVIVGYLNKKGYKNIALVDNFSNPDQYKNLLNKESLR
jgi:ADP-L-glycero-D-manno-heptose 6-epimerase